VCLNDILNPKSTGVNNNSTVYKGLSA